MELKGIKNCTYEGNKKMLQRKEKNVVKGKKYSLEQEKEIKFVVSKNTFNNKFFSPQR